MLNTLRVVRVKNFKQCRRCTGFWTIVITFFSLLFFLIFFNLFFFLFFLISLLMKIMKCQMKR